MIVKVCNADFSLQWDGMYQFALENYPQIKEWELEKLAKFIAYEQDHHRQTIVECENHELNIQIHDYLQEHSFFPPYRPSHRLVASTYDIQRKLVTSNYCSHTCTVEVAQAIFQIGKLMSAVKVFGKSGAELVTDSRNAASDPADYFDYIMFGWSNTTSGYRLAMERLLGRAPSEEELQEKFIPGVSFHFLYEELIQAPGYMFDGYHVAKVRDSLDLDTFLHLCVIPSKDKSCFEGLIPCQLQDRVTYLDYEGEGLQAWSTKVNQVLHGKDKLKGECMREIDQALLKKVIIERPRSSHKGDYGRLLLIGGTYPYGGAIIMAALGAVRSGAGLVTVATDKENIPALHSHLPEAMAFALDDKQLLEQQLEKANVVLVGPGLVDDERGEQLLQTVFHHLNQDQTLILDGGALSIFAKRGMKFPKAKLVLTPHQREWQALSGLDLTSQGTEETREALMSFPSGTILVQKGPATRIWQAGQVDFYQLEVGGPYQATGGMGDTLAGMIAGFAGQFPQVSLYERVTVATYLHSAIAQELAEDNFVVLPTTVSQHIPAFMKKIQKDT